MRSDSFEIRTPTADEIKRVLCDPEIWDRETDDYCASLEFPGLPESVKCIGGYVDGEIIGLTMIHDAKLHFAVLKPYRRFAREFLTKSVQEPVYCDIPDCYRAVINFAKNSGFIEFGKNGTYIKHGISYPRTRLCRS